MRSAASVMRRGTASWPMPLVGALSLAGIGVALYLTQLHYDGSDALCTGVGSCAKVNESAYATIGPVPVALLGLGAYATLLLLAVVTQARPANAAVASLGAFGTGLAGFAYSGYLTYVELFIIDAICPWCVVSAVLMGAIVIAAAIEVSRPPPNG